MEQNYYPRIEYVRELFIVAEIGITDIAKDLIINNTTRTRNILK